MSFLTSNPEEATRIHDMSDEQLEVFSQTCEGSVDDFDIERLRNFCFSKG
jgi:hypothetical protein